jgi:hypothetical protein
MMDQPDHFDAGNVAVGKSCCLNMLNAAFTAEIKYDQTIFRDFMAQPDPSMLREATAYA